MQDLSGDSDNIQTDKAWHDRRSRDGAVVYHAAISVAELCCYT
jgi:hypothetical protein